MIRLDALRGNLKGPGPPKIRLHTALRAVNSLDVRSTTPTPALVARFEAVPCDGGTKILWQLMDPSMFAEVQLQRSESEVGAWSPVEESVATEGRATFMVDYAAAAGLTYWYRLVAT